MTIIRVRPSVAEVFSPEANRRPKGGMFHRWHIRREQIRGLRQLLSLDDHMLSDVGVTRNQLKGEIAELQRRPI